MNPHLSLTKLATVLTLPLLAGSLVAQQTDIAAPIPLAHENSDIETDQEITWGVLENGMRYAIRPNAEPPERISLRLYVDAGSLMEADDQQGLAHFLEHMAFNGTKNFPGGDMVEYFQRLGVGFGSHTNAHTGFHETVYKLEMPTKDVEDGVKMLRDYADGLLFDQEQLDKERGVILSEKRSRDSVDWRTFVEQIKVSMPEGLIAKRLPIGTEEVIKNAPRDRFLDFYNTWYTPDRMVLVAVGDIQDIPATEAMIRQYFGDFEAKAEKQPEPNLGSVAERGVAVDLHTEMEAGDVSISIDTMKPLDGPRPDNKAKRLNDLKMALANAIITRRIAILSKSEDSPVTSGHAYASDLFDLGFADYASIETSCEPANWEAALAVAEQELRRAIEHGFTDAELAEQKAKIQNQAEKAAASMNTRQSRAIADGIAGRIGERKVFTNPAADLPRIEEALEQVTAEGCQQVLADLWNTATEKIVLVSGKLELDDPEAMIRGALEKSEAIAVEPPAQVEDKAFSYEETGAPGEIATRTDVDDLEVTQIQFANNVRLNLKKTDFEDNTVHVKARIGSGTLTEPKDKAGLSFYTGATFTAGGLEEHSADEIQRLFAGKNARASFSVDDDAFNLAGQTTPADLEAQLKLMRAYVIAPGYREEAATQLSRNLDNLYQQLETNVQAFMQDDVATFIHSGDTRFGFPDREVMDQRSLVEVKEWLTEPLATGYLELTVVGDLDVDQTIDLVARTFGNLPEREAEKPTLDAERQVAFPEDAEPQKYELDTKIDKAMALVYWPTTDMFDIERTRRLGMLGNLLDDRLRVKIREELGNAYSPFAHHAPSDAFEGYGYMFASATSAPDQAQLVTEVIQEIGADLAAGNITEDELERSLNPQINQIEEYRRTNGYWLNSVLASSQEYPQRLDWSRSFIDDYKNITLDDMKTLAKEYFGSYKGLPIIITQKPEAE